MTRLVPGQRLWPRRNQRTEFDPPVTVESIRRTWATVRAGRFTDDVAAEDRDGYPGRHLGRGDWPTTYYTDEGRVAWETRSAVHRSRRDINARLDAGVDLPTLNRVLVALGLPEAEVWTPPEGT